MADLKESLPIYIRIVEGIKEHILTKDLKEESQLPSTTYLSKEYKINIATVNKAMNILVNEGYAYKKEVLGSLLKKAQSLNWLTKEEKHSEKDIFKLHSWKQAALTIP